MNKFKNALIALLALGLFSNANAGGFPLLHVGSADGNGGVASYIGPVATNAVTPNNTLSFGASSQIEACSRHIARTDITDMRVAVPTWYNNHSTNLENALGGTLTTNLVIEYPVGTVAGTFKWGGNSQPTLPDNSNNVSDPLTISIPNGGVFMLHVFQTGNNGWIEISNSATNAAMVQNYALDAFNGEKFRRAASGLTMQATCSAITSINGAGQEAWKPTAILGTTTKPTLFLLGDSRMEGHADFYDDGSTNLGYARVFGPSYAYINMGTFALQFAQYTSSHTRRNELAAYCSHIIAEVAYNNLGVGMPTFTSAQQAMFAVLPPGKPIYVTTVPPGATSTDNFITAGNQTPLANNTDRVAYNTLIRSGSIVGATGYFEFADVAEGTRNSGVWSPSPSPITATYTGVQSTTVVTASSITSGTIAQWDVMSGNTEQISSFGTGAGGNGTYNVNSSATVTSRPWASNPPVANDGVHELSKMNRLYLSSGLFNPAVIHYP